MTEIVKILSTLAFVLNGYQPIAESCYAHEFVKTEGMELPNHVIKTVEMSFVELCWDECALLPRCLSINARVVWEILFECDLNDSNTSNTGLVSRDGSDFYEVKMPDESICELYSCIEPGAGLSAINMPKTTLSTTTATPTTQAKLECQLDFPRASTSDYVQTSVVYTSQLKKFCMTFWIKVPSSYNETAQILSYQTSDNQSSISMAIKPSGGFEISINGLLKELPSNFQRTNSWQNIIFGWRNNDGYMLLYRNGILEGSGHLASSVGETISPGGSSNFGKRHTSPEGGGAFQGSFSDFNMWDVFINDPYNSTATTIYGSKCRISSRYQGNFISWTNILKATHHGNIAKLCPATCL